MRGSGTHPPTAALFPSPIHAKFSNPKKVREALCETAFNSYYVKKLSTRFGEDPKLIS